MRYLIILLFFLMYTCPLSAHLKVVDGDSLELDGARIRLEGIDAPEYTQLCKDDNGKEYTCGKKALEYLQTLVKHENITCQCEEKPDRYKRKLCECFAGVLSLNQEMVRSGWAISYHNERMAVYEKLAQRQKVGIWQGKFMRPALYRILQREKDKRHAKKHKK